MKNWLKSYAPYTGTEPYIYFAFDEKDAGKVWPIMKVLLKRGIRVWYSREHGTESMEQRVERAMAAEITFLYLSRNTENAANLKSIILANQKAKRPIEIINPDGADRRLAMNLREATPELDLTKLNGDELEAELIHAPGITHEVFGEPVNVRENVRLSAVFCILAAIILCMSFVGVKYLGWFSQRIEDSVVISDTVIRDAARAAVGGESLTEENIGAITAIRIEALPESWEELDLFPALERIEMSQTLAMSADTLPEGCTIVLTGGGEA